MEEQITTTRTAIIAAFQKWNNQCIENPEDFNEIDESEDCAILQADKLIELLQ